MKTVAFFNNKGGVGKTSLVYHLAWMLRELGKSVLAVDLDPQSNLTSAFLSEDQLESIWPDGRHPRTIYGAIEGRIKTTSDVAALEPWLVTDGLSLLPGDLALSKFEDELSRAWAGCDSDEIASTTSAFLTMRALWRVIHAVGTQSRSDIALLDVGPNIGALNRAAMIATDFVVVPLAGDLFSLQGLSNLGPTLREWRAKWKARYDRNRDSDANPQPTGAMLPIGYVSLNPSVRENYPVQAYKKWTDRIPAKYAEAVLGTTTKAQSPDTDPACLAMIKHYKSLMPMAQEARKPMFLLRAKDGAIGGHAGAVQDCYTKFENLAKEIMVRLTPDAPPVRRSPSRRNA